MARLLRTCLLSAAVLLVVGGCLSAAVWQLQRARSGNVLSYAYVVEWPLFAVAAVVMWWQALHPPVPRPTGQRDPSPTPSGHGPWEEPDDALRAYNDSLRSLARGGRKSWRNPHGL
ncbi:MAG: hypothetical protein NVS3B12_04580 [Acidimicrobiales bacterium]